MTDNITIIKAPYSSYYLLIIINAIPYTSNWVLDNTDNGIVPDAKHACLSPECFRGTQTGKEIVPDAKYDVTPTK